MSRQPRRRLRIAAIGGGINSAVGRAHQAALAMDGRWTLVSGCFSRNPVVNEQTRIAYGLERHSAFNSAAELLDGVGDNVDAIVVLSPIPNHLEHVSLALEAGKHVICEKALAANSRDCSIITQLASSAQRRVQVTYNYSGFPAVRTMAHSISSGAIGDVKSVEIRMPQEGYLRRDLSGTVPSPQTWRQVDRGIPTVSLDLGVHVLHTVYTLTGELPAVITSLEKHSGQVAGVVDRVTALGISPTGVDYVISYGKTMLGERNGLTVNVYGTRGSLTWSLADAETVLRSDEYGNRYLDDRSTLGVQVDPSGVFNRFKVGHPSGFVESLANLYLEFAEEFYGNVEIERSRRYGAVISHDLLRVLETMHTSSTSAEWVTVKGLIGP